MYEHFNDYLRHLFAESGKIVSRDTAVCYYDCTNFFFETESEDDDYIDEITGETVRGLRKYGVSKEHRPNPIVQMGLFKQNTPPRSASKSKSKSPARSCQPSG